MSHPSAWFDVIPLWYGCHMETTTTPPVASRATTTPADILAMTTADLLTLGERHPMQPWASLAEWAVLPRPARRTTAAIAACLIVSKCVDDATKATIRMLVPMLANVDYLTVHVYPSEDGRASVGVTGWIHPEGGGAISARADLMGSRGMVVTI